MPRAITTRPLNHAPPMTERVETQRLGFTPHQVQALVRCANALDNAAGSDWGLPSDAGCADEVRRLAERVARCAVDGGGTWSADDVALLAAIGEGLVERATSLLEQPGVTLDQGEHAQFRLRLGTEIIAVRDRIREQLTSR
jgi:hypothetical protein